MDIAIVTPRYPPIHEGGGELSAQLLAKSLQRYGEGVDEVMVFSFDGNARETVSGVDVRRLGSPSSLITEYLNVAALPKLWGRLGAFDIVHAYNMELHPVVGYLSDREGFASVGTLNSYHYFPKSVINVTPSRLERLYELVGLPTTGRVLTSYTKRFDALVALSESLREIYYENGFAGCRIEHITNMIDPSFEVPDPSEEYNGFTLLYVGTLTRNKGIRYLVEAMASVSDDVSLRIVGDGPQEESLRRLASDYGVSPRIEFVGRVPYEEVPREYANADAFVHPGVWPEPLNRTVLEAMQAGLPVVCTDIGGPPEVVPDADLLCPPADPSALVAAVRRAMEKPPRSAARESREHVWSHHHPSVVVPQIVNLYTELCRDHDC
jgi:glycosyltransferase involved in cell wall biosynthesis